MHKLCAYSRHRRYSNRILYLQKTGEFSAIKCFIELNTHARFSGNRRQPVMTGLRRCAWRLFTVGLRGDNGVLTNNIS